MSSAPVSMRRSGLGRAIRMRNRPSGPLVASGAVVVLIEAPKAPHGRPRDRPAVGIDDAALDLDDRARRGLGRRRPWRWPAASERGRRVHRGLRLVGPPAPIATTPADAIPAATNAAAAAIFSLVMSMPRRIVRVSAATAVEAGPARRRRDRRLRPRRGTAAAGLGRGDRRRPAPPRSRRGESGGPAAAAAPWPAGSGASARSSRRRPAACS